MTNALVEQDASYNQKQSIQRMLLLEVAKEDAQWNDYTMEQTQVKLDLADAVMEHLVQEILDLM